MIGKQLEQVAVQLHALQPIRYPLTSIATARKK